MPHSATDCRCPIDDLGRLSEAHTKHRGQSGRGESSGRDVAYLSRYSVRKSAGATARFPTPRGDDSDTRPLRRGVLTRSSRVESLRVSFMLSWTLAQIDDAGQSIDQAQPAGEGVQSVSANGPSMASTMSSMLISEVARARENPPLTPRDERSRRARTRLRRILAMKLVGMFWASAISLLSATPPSGRHARWIMARMA